MHLLFCTKLLCCLALAPQLPEGEPARMNATLQELYQTFSFEPATSCDWKSMRDLFTDEAVFVQPAAPGRDSKLLDWSRFLQDFQAFVDTPALQETGLTEKILFSTPSEYGGIAHCFLSFDAFRDPALLVPTSRGLDSLQLVRTNGGWRVLSFTSCFQNNERVLPERFLGRKKSARTSPEKKALAQVEQLITGFYEDLSFPAGEECNWEGLREVFMPGAIFTTQGRAENSHASEGLDSFISSFKAFIIQAKLGETGFHERATWMQSDTFGDIAHILVAFEAKRGTDGAPMVSGLDSWQLFKLKDGWRVASVLTVFEDPERPLADWLATKK